MRYDVLDFAGAMFILVLSICAVVLAVAYAFTWGGCPQ